MSEKEQTTADALKKFAAPIQGQKAKEFDPMEQIPTLTVGDDLPAGSMIAGIFERVERLVSDKFKMSQEIDPATGKKVSRRVVLKRGEDRLAIWLSGALKPAFGDENNRGSILPGTYVEITYVGKIDHPTTAGQTMHEFKFKTGDAPVSVLN